eukprot:1488029-Pleurochrysis_carterae.AAC.10
MRREGRADCGIYGFAADAARARDARARALRVDDEVNALRAALHAFYVIRLALQCDVRHITNLTAD